MCDDSTNYIVEIEIARKLPSAKILQRIADALGLKPFFVQMFAQNPFPICLVPYDMPHDLLNFFISECIRTIFHYTAV